jgi:CRISPR type III-A-associated RAMP protein Csm5
MAVTNYNCTITTIGPVHIGTGKQYGKKDYFLRNGTIAILDPVKFTASLTADELDVYCEFLDPKDPSRRDSRGGPRGGSTEGLQEFLNEHNLAAKAIDAEAYSVDTKLSRTHRGTLQYLDIFEFIKDVYGYPYVPGSSLKGMLRTAILTSIVLKDQSGYANLLDPATARDNRKQKTAGKPIEQEAFNLANLDVDNPKNPINDILRYVSVSDSEPLSVNDLVFVKKYDKFARTDDASHKRVMGNQSTGDIADGNELNIYRECLKPGTTVEFSLSIDDRINKYLKLDFASLQQAIRDYSELYRRCFEEHFDTDSSTSKAGASGSSDGKCRYVMRSGPLAGSRCRNNAVDGSGYCNTHKDVAEAEDNPKASASDSSELVCYLGGGVDYDSKTITNALFADDYDRINEIARILYSQFPSKVDKSIFSGLWERIKDAGFEPIHKDAYYRGDKLVRGKDDHRHWRDSELGVSPHTLKLGKIGSELYPMGKCKIEIKERP